jgi:hypothetical protein
MRRDFSPGRVLQALGVCIILGTPFIFGWVVIPIVGLERIVGRSSVIYEYGQIVAFTNPLAIIECWIMIAAYGGAVVYLGRVMDRERTKRLSVE